MNLKIENITSKVTSLTNSSLWMPFLVKHGKVSKYYEQHCKGFQKLQENYKKPLKSASQSICNVRYAILQEIPIVTQNYDFHLNI